MCGQLYNRSTNGVFARGDLINSQLALGYDPGYGSVPVVDQPAVTTHTKFASVALPPSTRAPRRLSLFGPH